MTVLKAAFTNAVLVAFLASTGANAAFHEQGVAGCNGCHVMHNSQDGLPVDPSSLFGNQMLLLHGSSTDVCLSCHAAGPGNVLGADPLNPPPELGAGNFVFLLEDNLNDGASGTNTPIRGHHAGHNVVSLDYGIPADPVHAVAPGGNYPSAQLTCTSCHDPHGNQNFRMLRGLGSTDASGFVFSYDAPAADGIPLWESETPASHTAYRQGWSDWCANCHGLYHDSGTAGFEHPVRGNLKHTRKSYNAYDGPQDPFGGSVELAYVPQVPIEDPANISTSTFGATSHSRISCMTCHRAHATSGPKSTRWDPNVEFLSYDGLVSISHPLPNPYPDPAQKALCVKCHYRASQSHGSGSPCLECHRQ